VPTAAAGVDLQRGISGINAAMADVAIASLVSRASKEPLTSKARPIKKRPTVLHALPIRLNGLRRVERSPGYLDSMNGLTSASCGRFAGSDISGTPNAVIQRLWKLNGARSPIAANRFVVPRCGVRPVAIGAR
jgi:hypothetical protein